MMILFSYALPERQNQWMSYHHLLTFFCIRNPFGQALSSGLSTWWSKYYPVCLYIVAVIIAAVIDKSGKRIFFPASKRIEMILNRQTTQTTRVSVWWCTSIMVFFFLRTTTLPNGKERLTTIEKKRQLKRRENGLDD